MAIELPKETRDDLRDSLKRFFREELDNDIGDLKAELVLQYILQEVGPTVYNKAILDAQTYFQSKLDDLDGTCYEHELTYWSDS